MWEVLTFTITKIGTTVALKKIMYDLNNHKHYTYQYILSIHNNEIMYGEFNTINMRLL